MTLQPDLLELYRQTYGDRFRVDMPRSIRKLRETWQPYIEASLGFRNHWYPICLSHELDDGKVVAQKVCGEEIILRRVRGRVYGIEDRCPHRLVPFSMKPQCYTDDTITCWYHGFTVNWTTGKLDAYISDPESDLIGKVGVKTYPVEEINGLVFVFIGDLDPAPPVTHDLPPALSDEDRTIFGRRISVAANWRLGAENGFDSSHLFLHRESPFFEISEFAPPMAVGAVPRHENLMKYFIRPEAGPVGIVDDLMINYQPVWSADIGETTDAITQHPRLREEELEVHVPELSIWLPCGLRVNGFPKKDLISFEFYVPVDEASHLYFQLVSRTGLETEEKRECFRHEVDHHWTQAMFDDFNGDDVLARIGMETGYRDGRGWVEEVLTRNDATVIAWRQLSSRLNRGIQKLPSYG